MLRGVDIWEPYNIMAPPSSLRKAGSEYAPGQPLWGCFQWADQLVYIKRMLLANSTMSVVPAMIFINPREQR